MRYYKYLYLADGIRKKDKIIQRLEDKKLQLNIHVVTLARNEKNQLEIYNSMVLRQPDFPYDDFFVVGIAKGYEDAVEMVEEIAREVYNKTKGADIRSYILEREQEE